MPPADRLESADSDTDKSEFSYRLQFATHYQPRELHNSEKTLSSATESAGSLIV